MAERYHVPNWLQLFAQTAHCVAQTQLSSALPSWWWREEYLQNLVASRSQSETLTYDVSALQVWDLRWTLTSERLFFFKDASYEILWGDRSLQCPSVTDSHTRVRERIVPCMLGWVTLTMSEHNISLFIPLRSSFGSVCQNGWLQVNRKVL